MKDLVVEHPIFVRSNRLLKKKKSLEGRLPEQEGAWAVFRFIYDNFKDLRKIHPIMKKDGLEPFPKESREYLSYRFSFDPHIHDMPDSRMVLIHSYIMLYESIIPLYLEQDSFINPKIKNEYGYIPSSTDVRFRKF